MGFRRIVTIVFFLITLVWGTGFYFFAENFLIKGISCSRSIEQVRSSEKVIILTIPLSVYHDLEIERVSDQVSEIRYEGIQYDIYAGHEKNNIVYLTAIADHKEMLFMEHLKKIFSDDSKRDNLPTILSFFSFYYFESFNKIAFSILPVNKKSFLETSVFTMPGFVRKDYSPPKS